VISKITIILLIALCLFLSFYIYRLKKIIFNLYTILEEGEIKKNKRWYKNSIKELSNDLINQKRQMDTIFQSMSEYCVILNGKGQYIKANDAAKSLFPSIKTKKVGEEINIAKFIVEDGNEFGRKVNVKNRVINGETIKNERIIMQHGDRQKYFEVNGTPIYDHNGQILFGVLWGHDITNRIKQQKEITLKKEQLEIIINTISDMSILSIIDCEGNFLYYSYSGDKYFEKGAFNQKAGSMYKEGEYLYEDGSEIKYIDMPGFRVLRGEKITNFHFIRKTPERETHFLFNGTPVYDEKGKVSYCVFFTLDITEHVLHKKLIPIVERLQELNNQKDKLFTVMTHDIRAPLASMISLAELLDLEIDDYGDEIKVIIQTVKSRIINTYEMVDQFLDWIKSQRNGMNYRAQHVELLTFINVVIEVFQDKIKEKDIKILNNVIDKTTVYVDQDILKLVLSNLISNAIKYSRRGGSVTLEAKEELGNIIFSVKDNGIGMDSKQASEFFDSIYFKSTQGTEGEKGTGLGLFISKELIEYMGGKIWMESIENEGSTFSILIPTTER
jgi:PAS domain S-box-containing protein